MAMAATPPTTPPAIAPVGVLFFLDGLGVGVGVMVVVLGVVVVLGEVVETGVVEGVDVVEVRSCEGMVITTWAYVTTP